MLFLLDHPLGSDCSRRVTRVVVGERASIDHPCKSTWVRIVGGLTGGMNGNSGKSSIENAKTWIVVGDLYTVLSTTASLPLYVYELITEQKHVSSHPATKV